MMDESGYVACKPPAWAKYGENINEVVLICRHSPSEYSAREYYVKRKDNRNKNWRARARARPRKARAQWAKTDNGGDGVDGGGKIKNIMVGPLLLKLYQSESRTNKQNPPKNVIVLVWKENIK